MLRFADSFEHYGTGATGNSNMLLGAWASITVGTSVTIGIVNTLARTGSCSFGISGGVTNSSSNARFVIPGAALPVAGFGFGIYFPVLPANDNNNIFIVRDSTNSNILTLCFQADGSIAVKKGGSTGTLLAQTDSILTASTFHHIEFKSVIDSTVGEFELRVNGVTQLQLTNLNLGSANVAMGYFGRVGDSTAATVYFDDVVVWDDQGDYNNDFLGPVRVMTVYADGDGSPQDWTPVGSATAYGAIDETVQDGDTSYIGSDTVDEIATLTLPDLPPEVATITGVYIPALAKLDAAGIGELLVSMISGASELAGNDSTPLTTSYTYWPFSFDYNPATDAYWDKATFEAATVKIKKTL